MEVWISHSHFYDFGLCIRPLKSLESKVVMLTYFSHVYLTIDGIFTIMSGKAIIRLLVSVANLVHVK